MDYHYFLPFWRCCDIIYYIIIGGEVMYKLLIVEDDPGIAEGIKAQTEA